MGKRTSYFKKIISHRTQLCWIFPEETVLKIILWFQDLFKKELVSCDMFFIESDVQGGCASFGFGFSILYIHLLFYTIFWINKVASYFHQTYVTSSDASQTCTTWSLSVHFDVFFKESSKIVVVVFSSLQPNCSMVL